MTHNIKTPWSDAAGVQKSGLAQHADVLGDRGPCQVEPPGDGSGRHFAFANQPYDLELSRVAQSLNLAQRRQPSINLVSFTLR